MVSYTKQLNVTMNILSSIAHRHVHVLRTGHSKSFMSAIAGHSIYNEYTQRMYYLFLSFLKLFLLSLFPFLSFMLYTYFLASFPDSSHVAYIVLTFELACAKKVWLFCACEFKGQYYIHYIRGGESGNEATYFPCTFLYNVFQLSCWWSDIT